MTENESEQIEPTDAEVVIPNATKIAPHDGGFEPVERRKPIEDEGQPYTGHKDLAENALGVTPAIPRGIETVPPVDD